METAEHVRWQVSNGVATATIDRPNKRNALALQTIDELRRAAARADADADVRVLVLTGAGERAFASGADLGELPGAMQTPQAAAEYDRRVGSLYTALADLRIPVVARIQAHAIGGGCLLALACDIRIARACVTIGLPVSRIGLMLSPLEHRLLTAQVGASRAKLLLFTGRRLDAAAAERWGLVDVVCDDDGFDAGVDAVAGEIASAAPIAVRAAKRLVNAMRHDGDADAVAAACYREVYGSEDLREGLQALAEKRRPAFRAR
jgi:enoyl-CoA hydratase/carnithine racemase